MKSIMASLCFILTSCSYHNVYPNKWTTIIDTTNINYRSLSGTYEGEGDGSELYCNKISSILNITQNEKETTDNITIVQEECTSVTISSWHNGSLLGSKNFSKRDGNLACNKNGLNIKLPVVFKADIYVGFEWDKLILFNAADESLIVNHISSGVGMICIIPVGGKVSNWYRLVKTVNR